MKKLTILVLVVLTLGQCSVPEKKETAMKSGISSEMIRKTADDLVSKYGDHVKARADKGVQHAGSLWRDTDGTADDFNTFCLSRFAAGDSELNDLFMRSSGYFESIFGRYNQLTLDLRKNLDENTGPLGDIDEMFGSYSPSAHFTDDFFANKIAFVMALNFPYYSLAEKNESGNTWNDRQWAYARMGDLFIARVPAELQQKINDAETAAEIYISEYNIYMGKLVDNEGKKLFPEDMVLLSHWNLRDELKSDYADNENGMAKQKMIYEVMKRIIAQEIPEKVINSGEYTWNPYTNVTTMDGNEVKLDAEPDTRYARILGNFNAVKQADPYFPEMNTFIKRKFSGEMEISQPEVEKIFDEYLRSPLMSKLAGIIKQRLGRDLQAYDMWYDGFKVRGSIPEEKLDKITQERYPTPAAFEKALPSIMIKLGFTKDEASRITSWVEVDPARGSGHAWGAQMTTAMSHLRTRVPETGMNYKGYNIAVHEFGHNVEQTISLHDVPYYIMSGVPNTAFTEALAFLFQKRDLEILGMQNNDMSAENLKTLDICWSTFEIMGVSMVDMGIWKWMYDHPDATPAELKTQTINIAKDVWNTYFAPAYGVKDEPILAIYSHMVNSPLYLSNYSFGALIEFELGQFMHGKNFGEQVERIFRQGRLTPQVWMNKAVGKDLTAEPLLEAAREAVKGLE